MLWSAGGGRNWARAIERAANRTNRVHSGRWERKRRRKDTDRPRRRYKIQSRRRYPWRRREREDWLGVVIVTVVCISALLGLLLRLR